MWLVWLAGGASADEWVAEGERELTLRIEPGDRWVLSDLTAHGKLGAVTATCTVHDGRCVVTELQAGPHLAALAARDEATWGAGVQGQPGAVLRRGQAVPISSTPTCTGGVAGRRLCLGDGCFLLLSAERPRGAAAPFVVRRLTCAED